jgi:hypothetical protein
MGELQFSNNYRDLCEQYGVRAGFQFEFYCEKCGDTWRSEFAPYHSAQVGSWIDKAAGIFGGALWKVGDAVEGLAQATWGTCRDKALAEAIEAAKRHFHRCARCHQYVCDICWNKDKGLCLNCAPSAEVEIESAKALGEMYAVSEMATEEGRRRAKHIDVERDRQLICPSCGIHARGAKFCPECGTKLAVRAMCPNCSTEVSPDVKFCPECGERMKE